MAKPAEGPRPQGDPLRSPLKKTGDEDAAHPMPGVGEDDRAQQQSDAAPDTSVELGRRDIVENTDRDGGLGSTANGIPAFDDDAGTRRRQYDEGAGLVSETD